MFRNGNIIHSMTWNDRIKPFVTNKSKKRREKEKST